ncbi:DNA/RNA non-specific endonuclease [Burkholderia gladioli]|uniref:DNA/RNA non-specific endonuclease n=1 Tax=Burkholderia gladioli TaxID=28095 RepID=UPI001360B2CE|nr:DNA/RNA non-specific endonuclease [Burkholderia gladioli]
MKNRYHANGTLKSSVAKIRPEDLGTGTTTNASSRAAARAFGCASDDAGHPIARNFGGLGGVKKVFLQDPSTNRGAFRDFEGQIADQVARGDNVIVRVVPQYGAGSTRPDSILYQVRTNGVTESRTFANPCPCKCP